MVPTVIIAHVDIKGQLRKNLPEGDDGPNFVDVALRLLGRSLSTTIVNVAVQSQHELMSVVLAGKILREVDKGLLVEHGSSHAGNLFIISVDLGL